MTNSACKDICYWQCIMGTLRLIGISCCTLLMYCTVYVLCYHSFCIGMLITSCPCSCDYFLSSLLFPVFVHTHRTPCMKALCLNGMPLSFVPTFWFLYHLLGLGTSIALSITTNSCVPLSIEHLLCQHNMHPYMPEVV